MKIVRIFLASSSELKDDRDELQIHIGNKNKEWIKKDVFLELIMWEDFLDAMSQTRLQDEYNKAVAESDVFLLLFFSKVGKYTEQEFQKAFETFKRTNKPFIFTYFKDAQITTGKANKNDLMSLWNFQDKLDSLGHFYTVYRNSYELLLKFDQQLNKLAENGFISLSNILNENDPPTSISQLTQLSLANSQLKIQVEKLSDKLNEYQQKKESHYSDKSDLRRKKNELNKEIKKIIYQLPGESFESNKTLDKSTKFTSIIVGSISIAVVIAIYLSKTNISEELKPLLRILFALGCGGLSAAILGYITFKQKQANAITASGGFAVFILFFIFLPPVNYKDDFSTTIFLKDSDNNYIYDDKIKLNIRLKGNLKEGELIPTSKSYLFSQIPSNYRNTQLSINSKKWVFSNNRADTLIKIFDGSMDMPVKRKIESLTVSGYVYDIQKRLPNVSIAAPDFPDINKTTDTNGRFEIKLPVTFFSDSIKMNFSNKGQLISRYIKVGTTSSINFTQLDTSQPGIKEPKEPSSRELIIDITGSVVSEETQKGLKDVIVKIGEHGTTKTDSLGYFYYQSTQNGPRTILITAISSSTRKTKNVGRKEKGVKIYFP